MEEHLEHYATTFIEENSTVSAEQNLLNLFKIRELKHLKLIKIWANSCGKGPDWLFYGNDLMC